MFMKTNLLFFPEIEINKKESLDSDRDARIFFLIKIVRVRKLKSRKEWKMIMIKTENFETTRQTEYLLCVKKFHEQVKMGPFYVCIICNRCLYFSNVIKFGLEKYREFVNKLNTNVTSFEGNYICKTCDTHTRKLKVPGRAVVNGLIIEKITKE